MALMKCPECEHTVSDKAIACPGCGYPISSSPAARAPRTPKRRHPKLPNKFGSIKRLSGNRKNPYVAYPPTTEYKDNGSPVTVDAIGYFAKYHAAYAALVEWHRIQGDTVIQTNDNTVVITSEAQGTVYKSNLTFAEMYSLFYEHKFREIPGKKPLSESSKNSTRAAYKNCAVLHDKIFCSLVTKDMQNVVDNCKLGHASLELIVTLYNQMYAYAIQNDLTDKDYAQYVKIYKEDDDESGVPFSKEQLDILWKNTENEDVQVILIMIYSGFRISAYESIYIDVEKRYFKGGVKNEYSKDRIVPIHNHIFPFISALDSFKSAPAFRINRFYPTLEALDIAYAPTGEKHTPHDCRHTFSWLCDKYGVDSISKHMMMGHSLGNDTEAKVYSHRTLEQLTAEINKITV